MIDHPHDPVPTSIVRPAMESFAAYVIDRLTESLNFALDLRFEEPHVEPTEPDQPDALPEIGT